MTGVLRPQAPMWETGMEFLLDFNLTQSWMFRVFEDQTSAKILGITCSSIAFFFLMGKRYRSNLIFLSLFVYPIVLAPAVENTFVNELLRSLCGESLQHMCIDLFPHSPFCFMNLLDLKHTPVYCDYCNLRDVKEGSLNPTNFFFFSLQLFWLVQVLCILICFFVSTH